MADQEVEQVKNESVLESVLGKIGDKLHGDDSSSSVSVDDRGFKEEVKSKIYRLFGREKPVHKVLGGGKAADIFLWKNKKVTASVLGSVTAIWVLFEIVEYHLLTLVCHFLILVMSLLFLWFNVTKYIKKSPPKIPELVIREDVARDVASAIRTELNCALAELHVVASGKDLKKFFIAVAGLWVLSVLGGCLNFLTLFYICFVLLHTVPVVYDKYEDQVDSFAEKAEAELKKQYAIVLSKIPKGPLKDKFH